MPRVPDGYLESVVYLYRSVLDANQGEQQGGSGCLVYIPSVIYPNSGYTYVVTNSHVLREGGCLTVRPNGKDARPVVHETTVNDWIHHPDGDDVAVYHIPGVLVKQAQMRVLSVNRFLTPEIIKENEIGPGSDVFMAGRFINHQGIQINTPSRRFGNISMMFPEPIPHPRGFLQESFLVEMRSLTAYSGSPVMVYIPQLGSFGEITADTVPHMAIMDSIWLLGIVWGHTKWYENILEKDRETRIFEEWTVATNAGISQVVPVWKIRECLEVKQLADQREASEKVLAERRKDTDEEPP